MVQAFGTVLCLVYSFNRVGEMFISGISVAAFAETYMTRCKERLN